MRILTEMHSNLITLAPDLDVSLISEENNLFTNCEITNYFVGKDQVLSVYRTNGIFRRAELLDRDEYFAKKEEFNQKLKELEELRKTLKAEESLKEKALHHF